jgi:hypothetical protein
VITRHVVNNQGEKGKEKKQHFCEEERKEERELLPSEFSLLSSGPLCDDDYDDAVVVIHTSKSCSLLLFLLCRSNVCACSNLHPFVSSAPSCIWKTLSPMQHPPPPPPLLAAAACCCCKTDKNLYLFLSFFFRCPSVLQIPHPLHVQRKTVFFFFFFFFFFFRCRSVCVSVLHIEHTRL